MHMVMKVILSITAPMSYGTSAFGNTDCKDEEDNEHTRGELAWAPNYTFYTWDPPPGAPPAPPQGTSKGTTAGAKPVSQPTPVSI